MGIYWLLTIKWCTQGSYQKNSVFPTSTHSPFIQKIQTLLLQPTSADILRTLRDIADKDAAVASLMETWRNICSTFLVGPKDQKTRILLKCCISESENKKKTTSGETKRILIVLILPTRKMHNLFGKKNSKITIDLHQVCSLSKWVLSNLIISVSSEGFFGSSPNVSGTKNAGILYLIQ